MAENPTIRTPLHNDAVVKEFGRLEDKKYIAVLDLELTCWDDSDPLKRKRGEMEVTEIGVALLDVRTHEILRTFQSFVKPTYFPKLSSFCTNLTGITQADIESSRNLNVVISQMREDFLPPERELVWAAWGNDPKWLQDQLTKLTYKPVNLYRMDPRYINAKVVHTNITGSKRGLKEALKMAKLEQDLPHHRALPDAISTSKLISLYKIPTTEALISNGRTYNQAVSSMKDERTSHLSKAFNLEPHKARQLLKQSGWDYQRVVNILTILEVPRATHTI